MEIAEAPRESSLQHSLRAAEQEAENGESLYLIELVTSAIYDEKPEYTLKEIYDHLLIVKPFHLLDPLNLLPPLLPSKKDGTLDLLLLIAREGSAKEAVIAIQEALERIERADHDDLSETTESTANQLSRLLLICKDALPQLQLRRKSPKETLKSILQHFSSAIDSVAPHGKREEGRNIISITSQMLDSIYLWVGQYKQQDSELNNFERLLLDFLCDIVVACSGHIQASLAERRFQLYNPRLVFTSSFAEGSERGFVVMQHVVTTASLLGLTLEKYTSSPPSLGGLIILAHQEPSPNLSESRHIGALMSTFISSLKQNVAVDESLALLLTILNNSDYQLSEDIVDSLATILTPFASNHPNPVVRHIAFRILSSLLARSPAPVHLAHLTSLLSDCPYPQMRVAAVGLAKEAFLAANSSNANRNSPFRTNHLIRALGPTVFRPNPPDLFSTLSADSLPKFLESSEPARLTECLGFYYVLLMRDTTNSTGIRDRDMLKTVENGLLMPIRKALAEWMGEEAHLEDPHILMPLASLETSIERVDNAIASLTHPSR